VWSKQQSDQLHQTGICFCFAKWLASLSKDGTGLFKHTLLLLIIYNIDGTGLFESTCIIINHNVVYSRDITVVGVVHDIKSPENEP